MKVNLHQISSQLPWFIQISSLVKCHLLLFRCCFASACDMLSVVTVVNWSDSGEDWYQIELFKTIDC